jgi:hypothetical protein
MEDEVQFEDMHDDFKSVKRPGVIVLSAGVVTSVLTLAAIYFLQGRFPDFHPSGYFIFGIFPIGAVGVGLVAGLGYGIASWVTGAKIGKGLMLQVLVLQTIVYFCAEYVQYRMVVKLAPANVVVPSFWQYFDFWTRQIAFEDGQPLDVWGYGIRALQLGGFALGGLIAPAILFATPYCDKCRLYMKTKDLGLLPAGVVPRKVKKKDTEGMAQYEQEIEAALNEGQEMVASMLKAAEENKPEDFASVLAEHKEKKKEIDKLTSRIQVQLQHCRQCRGGKAVFKMHTGHGENVNTVEISQVDLQPSFIHSLESFA